VRDWGRVHILPIHVGLFFNNHRVGLFIFNKKRIEITGHQHQYQKGCQVGYQRNLGYNHQLTCQSYTGYKVYIYIIFFGGISI